MKVNGKRTRCTDKESSYGKMQRGMKDNLKMIKEKDEVRSDGRMVEFTKENGKTENSTELAPFQAKIILLKRASGLMAKKSDG